MNTEVTFDICDTIRMYIILNKNKSLDLQPVSCTEDTYSE